MRESKFIENLLSEAGITINGPNSWDIKIYNEQFYSRLLTNVSLGLGETYVDKWWDCSNLDQFFYKILTSNIQTKVSFSYLFWKNFLRKFFFKNLHYFFNYQTKDKSKAVGKIHYDIGNDLYQIMLDKRMTYSCAYWKNASNLDEAQERKLELICQKLYLKPGMKILDIGCGWGSFAKYAAERYQTAIIGITISKEQYEFANFICAGLPIELHLQDYRDLRAINFQFDRIVSLGMFEHVGFKNYSTYMNIVARCLKEDGLFLLHTIGANNSNVATNEWINAYIFPYGQIPSINQIGSAIEGLFVMEDWHNFGIFYDQTLMSWHQNFNDHWDKLRHKYDERFRRLWNYYLLSCAASFRARENQLWQIILSKKGVIGGYQRFN